MYIAFLKETKEITASTTLKEVAKFTNGTYEHLSRTFTKQSMYENKSCIIWKDIDLVKGKQRIHK